jgi:hypothetical protein
MSDKASTLPAEKLVGLRGQLKVRRVMLAVEIVAVDETQRCPKCGGPWGKIEARENKFIGGQTLVLAGTMSEGCLDDIELDEPAQPVEAPADATQ